MKKLYFSLLIFSFFTTVNAQIVNIPDAVFKSKLLSANATSSIAKNLSGVNFKIDVNNDGQIQESEAMNVGYLDVSSYTSNTIKISDLTGIQFFKNIQNLNCGYNKLTTLNLTDLSIIQFLDCSYNKLTSLNLTDLSIIQFLDCSYNELTTLNLTIFSNLKLLNCGYNQLNTLNLTGLTNLQSLNCKYNQLTSLTLTGLSNIQILDCMRNKLTILNLIDLTNLQNLNCRENTLTELNVVGLYNLRILDCITNQLTTLNLTGLTNLQKLDCRFNKLSELSLTGFSYLQTLYCGLNKLTELNLMGLYNLIYLDCSSNQLTELNLTGLSNLFSLNCEFNQITSLDLSILPSLRGVIFIMNNKLETLFIKNGLDNRYLSLYGNPTLKYICVDDAELVDIFNQLKRSGYNNCHVNSYCSFTPGGTSYTIQGNQKLDSNINGCDVNDIIMPNLKYTITNGTTTGGLISDTSGNYSIPVQAGTHTITPVFENPSYFSVSPTTVNVTFPTQTSPVTRSFCITPNGVRPDLEVTLLPLAPARPGFDAKYKLVYKNKGNTIQSGSVNLSFNDAVLDLVVANPAASNQATNNLSWNFTNLQPFETREITFTMNVNSPMETPAVNIGAILGYTVTITSSATDETPADNTFTFNQTVVGSYDPNDKTCLEGSVITPNLIGQYVHYTIRFENTGTFAAENVVVKDMIDLTKFDISTLVPTSASHSYTTRISDGNKVEFIFENINLPFDDANNDGYIAFKIKTKPTLVVNDSFSNEASIFFDYNFPIVTNKATSTFKTLGTQDFDFDSYFTVYPNPATTFLNIASKESINIGTINVYNTLGQLVLAIPNAEKVSNVDVSNLTAGNYFIQIKTDKGNSSSQFVKE